MDKFEKNDRVQYTYYHYFGFNLIGSHNKIGSYIGRVRHTRKYTGYQLALVHFDGNENVSRVQLSKLRLAALESGHAS